jgi:hypothetical protein
MTGEELFARADRILDAAQDHEPASSAWWSASSRTAQRSRR